MKTMREKPRLGQYMVKQCGSDRYAATVKEIDEKSGIVTLDNGYRVKKNRTKESYGEVGLTGHFYESRVKYRSSWIPVEGKATTYLDPGF